jgi:hypothetical protein
MKKPSKFALSVAFVADRLGICLSGLCLIHCILTPFVLLALPSLAVASFENEGHHLLHEVLLVILPVLALAAFIPGFRRHRDLRVFYWSVPGIALLAIAVTIFHDNMWIQSGITISGSIFLIRAHVLNRHLCACCESHPKKEEATTLSADEPVQRVSSASH